MGFKQRGKKGGGSRKGGGDKQAEAMPMEDAVRTLEAVGILVGRCGAGDPAGLTPRPALDS